VQQGHRYAWAVSFVFVAACGGEPLGPQEGPDDSELVGQTQEAVQTAYDVPVAATVRPYVIGEGFSHFTFVVDTAGNLLRNIRFPTETPVTRPWEVMDTGVVGPPTAAPYRVEPNLNGAVDVFARSKGGNLWEYYFPDTADLSSSHRAYNVSDLSGFRAQYGAMAGTPLVAEYGNDGGAVSIIVQRASDHTLYSIDFTRANGWAIHPVLDGANIVVSENALSSADQLGYFAGRGLSASEDGIGWVATRTIHRDFAEPFHVVYKFSTPKGTPSVSKLFVAASFVDDSIKIREDGQWSRVPGCLVGGSPALGTFNDYGVVRGSNGHLFGFYRGGCSDYGEILTSAPTPDQDTNVVFFRGQSGFLHARDTGTGASWGFNVPLP
jgi:hypothetical protein